MFQSILYILLAIVILLVMIVIHELGHYIAGRILKFKINEFAVGFGPKLLQKKNKRGELVTLRAVPLGGYCAFYGEDEATDSAESGTEKPLGFNEQKPWKRIIVFFAGAFFNLVSAVIFSIIFLSVIGVSVATVSDVYYENDNASVKYNAFDEGDRIVAVNGKKAFVMYNFAELMSNVKDGETAVVTVERDGKIMDISVQKKQITTVNEDGEEYTYSGLGIGTISAYESLGFGKSIAYSVPYTVKMSWTILGTFGKLITGKLSLTNLTGPVGTVTQVADLAKENSKNILILLPLIAANLAVFNLLPIPALDGSKIVFAIIEWIRKKPLKQSIENMIHLCGIILIFGFVIIIDLLGIFLW